jgi:uncharacterized protein (TIGR02265 family)
MPEKLIFGPAFRAMLQANVARMSPKGVEQLKGLGVDPHGKLEAAYPSSMWAECARVMAYDIDPSLPLLESSRLLARRTVDAYADDLVGRLLFGLTRLIGMERTLTRMTKNLRSGGNFHETRLTRISQDPIVDELWVNDVSGLPGYYLGLLEGGMVHTMGFMNTVTLERSDGVEAVYHFRRVPKSED